MNELKCRIRELLQAHQECDALLREYEQCYPRDLELYEMKADNALLSGDVEAAYAIARQAVSRNPYSLRTNACMMRVCEARGSYIEALQYDARMNIISEECKLQRDDVQKTADLEAKLQEQGEQLVLEQDRIKLQKYNDDRIYFEKQAEVFFGLLDRKFWSIDPMVGSYFIDAYGKSKYTAVYSCCGIEDVVRGDRNRYNALETKLEFREVVETKDYRVGDECEYLLPVLARENDTEYRFTVNEQEEFVCRNRKGNHFNYYRIPPKTRIQSEHALLLGNPVQLKQEPKNKKLVLNIFIDGLSQKVIEEENFSKIMPHTYRFFKKGVICTNTYTAGEWTLPSIAAYNTGLNTLHHRMIHNKLATQLPEDVTLLSEYFKEQGYTTAKIDGEWRSTLSYGYGRGMDRMIYQHQTAGMKAEEVIPDALDHMMLMKETDQYIWMGVGDLHDIADGFDLKPSVQARMPLRERVADEVGATSVKQDYSEHKRAAYIRQMRHIDTYLRLIYYYIEDNYEEDDIVVSAFGDHGQGYLVKEEEHFLAPGRSKVAMMFRGGERRETYCDELLSTCDYLPIMCRLAGIPMKNERIDGQLPVFFGGVEKRRAVFTDSIHPGDSYMAALVTDEATFYLTSQDKVSYDGRFHWEGYTCSLCGKNGEAVNNEERIRECAEQIKEHVSEYLIYE